MSVGRRPAMADNQGPCWRCGQVTTRGLYYQDKPGDRRIRHRWCCVECREIEIALWVLR